MRSVFFALAAFVLSCSTPAFANNEFGTFVGQPLPTLSLLQGRALSERCAWAPNDASVCKARAFCKNDPANRKCAKYCTVNPYDVVCGDVYRPRLPHVYPSYGDSPYPWARSGGGFCDQNPGNIGCQDDYLLGDWRW